MYLQKLLDLKQTDKVAVVGLGQENLQFLDWLINIVKFDVTRIYIADQKSVNLSNPILKNFLLSPENIFSGENYLECLKLDDVKMVFKAPGVWSLKPEFCSFRDRVGDDSIHSSLVFFFERYREQIIAITGTKGKSTTSSLLNHLLSLSSDITSHYCGNTTNISPYQFWTELEQPIKLNEFFVVEASSFQLQDLRFAKISPKYGIITNYFIDHQDQHAKPEEYWAAKDTVFEFQTPSDTTLVTKSVIDHSQSNSAEKLTTVVSPELAHKIVDGLQTTLQGEHNVLNIAQAILMYLTIITKKTIEISNLSEISLLVESERVNIQKSLNTYQPLAHRQEIFAQFSSNIEIKTKKMNRSISLKVRFVDDGAATEPDAVIAAINTLTSNSNQYIWLFLTGVDKGIMLEHITQTIIETQFKNQLFQIHYCGQVGQNILSYIFKQYGQKDQAPLEVFKPIVYIHLQSKAQIVTEFTKWLNDKVMQLEEIHESDKINTLLSQDIELNIALSPCGASFDEFENYQERSEWFKNHINTLLI